MRKSILLISFVGYLLTSCGGSSKNNDFSASTVSGYAWAGVKQRYEIYGNGLNSSTLVVKINDSTCEKFNSSSSDSYLKVLCTNPITSGTTSMNIVDGDTTNSISIDIVDPPSGKFGFIKINSDGELVNGDNSEYDGKSDVCVLQTRDFNENILSKYLIWEVKRADSNIANRNNTGVTFATAKAYSESASICGKTSWRLPTTNELANLYDSDRGSDPRISVSFFRDADDTRFCYWANVSGSIRCFSSESKDKTTTMEDDNDVLVRLVREQ